MSGLGQKGVLDGLDGGRRGENAEEGRGRKGEFRDLVLGRVGKFRSRGQKKKGGKSFGMSGVRDDKMRLLQKLPWAKKEPLAEACMQSPCPPAKAKGREFPKEKGRRRLRRSWCSAVEGKETTSGKDGNN